MKAQWIGPQPYSWALRLQRARRRAVIEHRAPEVLWLLEHPPVVTLGRRGGDVTAAREAGLPVVATERGGLATYHGPGQLVGYLICALPRHGLKVREVVTGIESGVIDWLGRRGVEASRRPGAPGIWVGSDKICAIGLHFRKGVSMHGFALNLCVDLDHFSHIVPCGITDGGVTSLERLVGRAPRPRAAAGSVGASVLCALGLDGFEEDG